MVQFSTDSEIERLEIYLRDSEISLSENYHLVRTAEYVLFSYFVIMERKRDKSPTASNKRDGLDSVRFKLTVQGVDFAEVVNLHGEEFRLGCMHPIGGFKRSIDNSRLEMECYTGMGIVSTGHSISVRVTREKSHDC